MDEIPVSIEVNGRMQRSAVEPRQLLVHFLRVTAGLTGTHVGCDTSYCGACTVLLDGAAVKACTVLTVQADGRKVRTVEGLAQPDRPHALQESFSRHHALQCGYCTPGKLMSAASLLEQAREVDEAAVRKALAGNICRCTGYQPIVEAVLDAARTLRKANA